MTSIDGPKKSRGRPPVDTEAVKVRMPRSTLAKIDEWRATRDPVPSRPEVIREMVETVIRMGGLDKAD
jgi:Arc/MetJ-type ribon-helix-helix transcriptional regulator